MNDARKLAFVANQTAQALNHAARTPNVMHPDGKMSHEKMLSFVAQITKQGLQHFDSGGAVSPTAVQGAQLSGPTAPAPIQTTIQTPTTENNSTQNAIQNPSASLLNPSSTFGWGGDGKTNADQNAVLNPTQSIPALLNPAQSIGNAAAYAGDISKNVASDFTVQNQFQATGANTQQGTNGYQLGQAYTGVQGGLNQQQSLANTLSPGVAQGAGAQSNLSQQLSAEAAGGGPNPAQAQFKQNANDVAAQTAGAIASAKGISPALQARLIAQQGASAGQNAAGQAATLEAQQQLAAQNNLQNLSANQVAQGSTAVQGVNNAQQNEQNILQNANTAYNNSAVAQQSNLNTVNAGVAQNNADAVNKTENGLFGGLSAIASIFNKGGMVKSPQHYDDGGSVDETANAPQSYVGQWLNSNSYPVTPPNLPAPAPSSSNKNSGGGGIGSLLGLAASAAKGGLMTKGGAVNAKGAKEKAKVSGDNLKNDKIPAMLSEGEIVIPRHITMSDRAPEKAAAFVAHTLAKKRMVK